MNPVSATAPVTISATKVAVSNRLLLSLYAIVPVSLLLVLADQLFLDARLKAVLPDNPASLLLWAIVFNFPHIVSSLITLIDDEYIAFYKQRFLKNLAWMTALVLGVTVLAPLVLPKPMALGSFFLFFTFFAAYTMYHVLSQQFGLAMMMMKAKPGTPAYERWRWLATLVTTLMYGMVFIKPALQQATLLGHTLYDLSAVAAGVLLVPTLLQGLLLARDSQTALGTWYTLSNLAMLVASYVLLLLGYPFFVIALPRFVHDLTAFIIYSVHDQNRNAEFRHNRIYRFLKFLPIPVLVLCPILAITVAHSVQCGSLALDLWLGFDKAALGFNECPAARWYTPTGLENGIPFSMQVWIQIMFICGLFHYHVEAYVWKRDAIHRHAVVFR